MCVCVCVSVRAYTSIYPPPCPPVRDNVQVTLLVGHMLPSKEVFWLQKRGECKPGLEPSSSRDDKCVFYRADASLLLGMLESGERGPEPEAVTSPASCPWLAVLLRAWARPWA